MSEKRFRCEFDRHYGYLFDDEYETFYQLKDSESNIELFCERLNELYEENQQLKQYKEAIWDCDSSKIIRVNKNTGEVDLIDKELEE